jgi:hypothetical protein
METVKWQGEAADAPNKPHIGIPLYTGKIYTIAILMSRVGEMRLPLTINNIEHTPDYATDPGCGRPQSSGIFKNYIFTGRHSFILLTVVSSKLVS